MRRVKGTQPFGEESKMPQRRLPCVLKPILCARARVHTMHVFFVARDQTNNESPVIYLPSHLLPAFICGNLFLFLAISFCVSVYSLVFTARNCVPCEILVRFLTVRCKTTPCIRCFTPVNTHAVNIRFCVLYMFLVYLVNNRCEIRLCEYGWRSGQCHRGIILLEV